MPLHGPGRCIPMERHHDDEIEQLLGEIPRVGASFDDGHSMQCGMTTATTTTRPAETGMSHHEIHLLRRSTSPVSFPIESVQEADFASSFAGLKLSKTDDFFLHNSAVSRAGIPSSAKPPVAAGYDDKINNRMYIGIWPPEQPVDDMALLQACTYNSPSLEQQQQQLEAAIQQILIRQHLDKQQQQKELLARSRGRASSLIAADYTHQKQLQGVNKLTRCTQQPCRFYAQGNCTRDGTCPFAHSTDRLASLLMAPEDRRRAVWSAGKGQQSGWSSRKSSKGSSSPPWELELPAALEEEMRSKYTSLEEVAGQIVRIAKDQDACRFLQKKFDEGNPEDIETIFDEVIDHIVDLMTDPFANYLVQKLLEFANDAQRREILRIVTRRDELVRISLNQHGTRAVQKLIETLKPWEVSTVTNCLKQGVVTLIKDLNGNHVIQKCLQKLSSEHNNFIFDAAVHHCLELGTHRHGCCVLQRCVDHAYGAKRNQIISEVAAHSLTLSQDMYGNYVVQYILERGQRWSSLEVMLRLEGNYTTLSMQKCSSNVVEKCLQLESVGDMRARIVHELITSPHFSHLLQDPYGNYVVQCALNNTKGHLHAALVEAIRPHVGVLRTSPFGKRVLTRANIKNFK